MRNLFRMESKILVKPIEKQQDFSNEVNKLRQTLKQEYDLKSNLNTLKKELHLQRLKSLRELSDKLKDDSWKYPSVDKLLGL